MQTTTKNGRAGRKRTKPTVKKTEEMSGLVIEMRKAFDSGVLDGYQATSGIPGATIISNTIYESWDVPNTTAVSSPSINEFWVVPTFITNIPDPAVTTTVVK